MSCARRGSERCLLRSRAVQKTAWECSAQHSGMLGHGRWHTSLRARHPDNDAAPSQPRRSRLLELAWGGRVRDASAGGARKHRCVDTFAWKTDNTLHVYTRSPLYSTGTYRAWGPHHRRKRLCNAQHTPLRRSTSHSAAAAPAVLPTCLPLSSHVRGQGYTSWRHISETFRVLGST